jgi:hypothetical protein
VIIITQLHDAIEREQAERACGRAKSVWSFASAQHGSVHGERERDGYNSLDTKWQLAYFEELQNMHIAHRTDWKSARRNTVPRKTA